MRRADPAPMGAYSVPSTDDGGTYPAACYSLVEGNNGAWGLQIRGDLQEQEQQRRWWQQQQQQHQQHWHHCSFYWPNFQKCDPLPVLNDCSQGVVFPKIRPKKRTMVQRRPFSVGQMSAHATTPATQLPCQSVWLSI